MVPVLYQQVKLQLYNGELEVSWIPKQFAKEHQLIFIDDLGTAIVLEVYEPVLDKAEIEINRKYPLRDATDI
jgi:hypothetical protein